LVSLIGERAAQKRRPFALPQNAAGVTKWKKRGRFRDISCETRNKKKKKKKTRIKGEGHPMRWGKSAPKGRTFLYEREGFQATETSCAPRGLAAALADPTDQGATKAPSALFQKGNRFQHVAGQCHNGRDPQAFGRRLCHRGDHMVYLKGKRDTPNRRRDYAMKTGERRDVLES